MSNFFETKPIKTLKLVLRYVFVNYKMMFQWDSDPVKRNETKRPFLVD